MTLTFDLQQVFRTVIISKTATSQSAWWSFTSASDRQHLNAFLCHSVRSGLCPPELSDLTELVEAADDKLSRPAHPQRQSCSVESFTAEI